MKESNVLPPAETTRDSARESIARSRYEMERQTAVLRDRIRDVAARTHTSAYISGPPGTGKSHLVRSTLKAIDHAHAFITGHLTAMGFFDVLAARSTSTIVLDDVSSLFQDKIGRQLLLAALSSSSDRTVARPVEYRRRGKVERVYFEGGLIALSNLELGNSPIESAVKSRTKPLRWDPSADQLEILMRDAVVDGWQSQDRQLSAEECAEVIDFLVAEMSALNIKPDLRLLFETALPDRAAQQAGLHEVDWRDHVNMILRERVGHLRYSSPPMSRADRIEHERKIAEQIRSAHGTSAEQVKAWHAETGKSERSFYRRSSS